MMRLHSYYRSSASYRVRLALAHKNIPFELVPVPIRDGVQYAESYLAKNPLGQVPVLELEGEQGPIYLSQSLAIMEYLEDVYPDAPLLPKDPIERARVRELSELVNAGIQPLQNIPVLDRVRDVLHGDPKDWLGFFVGRGLTALEQRARHTSGRFLVGNAPSMADVCLLPQLYGARRFEVPLGAYETLLRVEEHALTLPRWAEAHPDRQPDADPPKPT